MEIFFIILLLLILIGVCVFTIMQHQKHQKEKREWERSTEEKYRKLKSESDEYIRETFDKISDNTQEYENKSERDILMDIILALATYGRRIDRIDDKLESIYNYKSYIDSMNSQAKKVSEYFIVLNNKTTELENIFSVCRNTLQKTSKDVNILNQHFTDMVKLEESIEECIDWLSEYSPQIHSLSQQVKQILQDMEDVISACDSSPVTKLKNIESLSEKIHKKLGEIHSDIEDMDSDIGKIDSDIADLSSDISDIDSDVSTIKSAVDEYDSDSLYSKIDRLKSVVSDLDSSIDEIKSAVDKYSYDSLYSKIDELKSIISN